jgi:competence protein ComEA
LRLPIGIRKYVNRGQLWIQFNINVLFFGGGKMLKLGRNEERLIIIIITVLILAAVIYRFAVFKTDSVKVVKQGGEEISGEDSNKPASDIYIYITGGVKNPGIYKLKSSDRVADAVNAAGGFTEKADVTSVNLAEKIRDEQHLNINEIQTTEGITVENTAQQKKGSISGGKININTATAEELDAFLPGIGITLANNIVNYREKYGSFKSDNDITRVDRIGSGKTFERIKDLITIN